MRISKEKQKAIARERIRTLFKEAQAIFSEDSKLADKYVEMARKIAMKARIRVPSNLKRKFCKHCYKFFQPGVNLRVRTKNNKVIYYCLNCKKYMRFPFLKEKKLKVK